MNTGTKGLSVVVTKSTAALATLEKKDGLAGGGTGLLAAGPFPNREKGCLGACGAAGEL